MSNRNGLQLETDAGRFGGGTPSDAVATAAAPPRTDVVYCQRRAYAPAITNAKEYPPAMSDNLDRIRDLRLQVHDILVRL